MSDPDIQPIENDLEKIRKHIEQGGTITIPPDPVPVPNIDVHPIPEPDWEAIRKAIEGGAKIEFNPPTQ